LLSELSDSLFELDPVSLTYVSSLIVLRNGSLRSSELHDESSMATSPLFSCPLVRLATATSFLAALTEAAFFTGLLLLVLVLVRKGSRLLAHVAFVAAIIFLYPPFRRVMVAVVYCWATASPH
jgi:hypothetical protein